MKAEIIISILLLCPLLLSAQSKKRLERQQDRMGRKFERFEEKTQNSFTRTQAMTHYKFERFKARQNEEYAKFMAKTWARFSPMPALTRPLEPKPDIPPIVIPDADEIELELPDYPIPFEDIIIEDDPILPPDPIKPPAPKPADPQPVIVPTVPGTVQFDFYGRTCEVAAPQEFRFSISSVDEVYLSELWIEISDGRFNGMLSDCFRDREELSLCDWAYLKYVQSMTEAYLGEGNAAVFLQHYLLAQSGCMTRLARAAGRLSLLVCFDQDIYDYKFISLEEGNLIILDRGLYGEMYFNVLGSPFEGERLMSVRAEQPQLAQSPTQMRELASEQYPQARAKVSTNRNLLKFYDEYPRTSRWDFYSMTSLSPQAKAGLYPALQKAIEGLGELDAVTVLLNFVQTSFEYMTDQDQFGYERPLFPDETLYYPYSDCEDRAILFTALVRELVGLDTVLLYYPGHLAAAVRFTSEVSGDYLIYDGKKYVVCDPTYKYAGVGLSMPDYKNVTAEVLPVGRAR